jgi:hypothetical protein
MTELEGYALVPNATQAQSCAYFREALKTDVISELGDAVVFLRRSAACLPADELAELFERILAHRQLRALSERYRASIVQISTKVQGLASERTANLIDDASNFVGKARRRLLANSPVPYANLEVHRVPSVGTDREVYVAMVTSVFDHALPFMAFPETRAWGVRLAAGAGLGRLHLACWSREGGYPPEAKVTLAERTAGLALVSDSPQMVVGCWFGALVEGSLALDAVASRILTPDSARYIYAALREGARLEFEAPLVERRYSRDEIERFRDKLLTEHHFDPVGTDELESVGADLIVDPSLLQSSKRG